MENFKIGEAVVVTAGKSKGTPFAIVGYSDERLLISDGRTRKLHSPKPKSKKHVERLGLNLPQDALSSNKKLRCALRTVRAWFNEKQA